MNIGILGNGQLGAMMALAAYPLGHRVRFFAPQVGEPTAGLGDAVIAPYNDLEALKQFAQGLDVVTFEFENVEPEALELLAQRVAVFPSPQALMTSQDRLREKTFFQNLGAKTPDFRAIDSLGDLETSIEDVGLPAVLKTRRFGYDGKGQFVLRQRGDCQKAWDSLGKAPGGLILEAFVPFERELSLISVRSKTADLAFYPLVENHHKDGILDRSIAPAPSVSKSLQSMAEDIAVHAMKQLEYVGVLTIEFFERNGELLVNEMAPRVHNSGHWTIEGAVTSQFANHVRAVCGEPLGSTQLRGSSVMFNLVGTMPSRRAVLEVPGAHWHDYGKTPRPARKLGHVTVNGAESAQLQTHVDRVRKVLAAHS